MTSSRARYPGPDGDPRDWPTAAMPVTDPRGLPQPRPYVAEAEPGATVRSGLRAVVRRPAEPAPDRPAAADDPWLRREEWQGAVAAADGPLEGLAGTPTLGEPREAALEAAGPPAEPVAPAGPPVRVTVADIALAQHLEAVDPLGTLGYVDLARAAREWLTAHAPRRWPVERKVWAGALGALLATVLAGVLTWAVDNVPAMAGVPSWLGPVLIVAGPPVASWLLAYAARHTPRVVPVLPELPPKGPDGA